MLRTGQSPAPSTGRSSSASTPGSHPTPGVLLPGTLASPRTGLTPAGCRELVTRLHRRFLLSVTSAPELLDAHPRGIARGGCSRPAGLAPAAPGGGVAACPRRPGQGQGPPQAVPQGRNAPLTR